MIRVTDFDQLMANHTTRIDRVNRDGWIRAATPCGIMSTLAISTVIASIRQRSGRVLVVFGERLQGTTVRHAVDPSSL